MPSDLAVFSRNHLVHLDEAAAAAISDPSSVRVFRSMKRWVSAAAEVSKSGPIPVYFAVIDAGPEVSFAGELVDVEVDPAERSKKTRDLLAHAGATTDWEGLWKGQVKTLFLVRGCHRIPKPFPQSKLKKFKDGIPLSEDFIRTYALVQRID